MDVMFWASNFVMCARFQILWLSDQKWFWLVCFICVVCWSCLNIPVYAVVCAEILEQLLHIMRETQNFWVIDAAHKPRKAWGKNDQSDLQCQVPSPWHELLITLAWALTLLTCTLEATGLNLRQDTIWSGWLFLWFSSVSPDEYHKICHDSFIPCSFQSPSRAHYTVQWDRVYSNIRQVFFLKYNAWTCQVIRNSCKKSQLDTAEQNQDLHCQIVM